MTALAAGTLGDAVEAAAGRLRAAGVATARLDARLLAAHVVGIASAAVPFESARALDDAAGARLEALVDRRLAGEPVAKIVGEREFWSLPFRTTCDTLDPRPDSETLIEAALAAFPEREAPIRILDLGTGTGCLLLAFLSERTAAKGLGIDRSPAALDVARENAARLGLADRATFRVGDWCAGLDGLYDCILANPPYIQSREINHLTPDVARYEPRMALDGGEDGLDAYRALIPGLANRLAGEGTALLEVGEGQSGDVCDVLAQAGLVTGPVLKDLAGKARVVSAMWGDSRFVD